MAAKDVGTRPRYVIGTEVPAPGGAAGEIKHIEVTSPDAVAQTLGEHEQAFAAAGAQSAFDRVLALVVQPGVEFDDRNVVVYQPDLAQELAVALAERPALVFEAHSTDYQPTARLARLVSDGFAILKVGPALTFAMREALYSLDLVAGELDPSWRENGLRVTMEREMLASPGYWERYYTGNPEDQQVLRHFSYSDRIRYYWAKKDSKATVQRLLNRLDGTTIPPPLVSQYLPNLYPHYQSSPRPSARRLLIEAVKHVLG